LTGVILDCSDKEAELRSERVNANFPAARPRAEVQALETFSAKKEAELFARFVKNGTWQCPTLTVRPTESLRAATLNPAKFFGLDQKLGTIEQGKLADLVLLEANPLEDIRNTQRIDAVITNGRFYDRKALDKMLAQAQTIANQR
jgi:predicted amidohydrolase YtcJ